LSLLAVLSALAALAADRVSRAETESGQAVAVLLASGHPAYAQAERAMRAALQIAVPAATFESVTLDDPDGAEEAAELLASRPSLIVAIGSRAAKAARAGAAGAPVVYAMVLDPASIDLPGPGDPPAGNTTGVTMDVPPERHFELIREILPSARRIGVLYDPATTGKAVQRAQAAAKAHGLQLLTQPVRSESEVLEAAALIAPAVDAVWAIADPRVLTPSNARALILLWLRAGKPLFAMSEGFVRNGALAALAPDPEEIGRRAGELAVRILRGTPTSALEPEPPPHISIFLNRASALHLGISLPEVVVAKARNVYPAE